MAESDRLTMTRREAAGLTLLASTSTAAPLAAPTGNKIRHGAAYYPELWPAEEVAKDIARMHEAGITVVRIGEFAWSKMEPNEGQIDLTYFADVMDRLHAAGIATVLCTPTATPPIWLVDGHPERCYVNQQGVTMVHGARQHASYDHPDVQRACWRIVEAMAQALGKHPGLIGWQIDNELKCHVQEDFSPASVDRWHVWLKARYGTIDKLNDAWGAEIWSQRYQRFQQVPAPRQTPFVHNASLSTAYKQFSRAAITDFLKKQCELIRAHSKAPITHNMSESFGVSLEQFCEELDFASFDAYPTAAQVSRMLLRCDLFRAAKPGRPFWVMETSAAHNGYLLDYQPAHPPGFLAAEAVACTGLGAEAFCYWLWRQQRTGCELPHSALLSAWGTPGVGFEQVKRATQAFKDLNDVFTTTTAAPAEIAITWSDRGRVMMDVEPLGRTRSFAVNYSDMIGRWHALMVDHGLHRDLRLEGAALDGLKILVTPAMLAVDDKFRARVEAWVRQGGIWICGPLTGARTTEHTVPTDAGLGALDGLGGVETVFSLPLTGTGAQGEAFGQSAPLSGWAHLFRPRDSSTRTLGVVRGGPAPGLAWLTERALGRGSIVMLGADPQGEAGDKLLLALVNDCATRAGVKLRWSGPAGTLACPRIDAKGATSWIVVNLDGRGGEARTPAGTVKVESYGYGVARS
jgi:beta-galactosidase